MSQSRYSTNGVVDNHFTTWPKVDMKKLEKVSGFQYKVKLLDRLDHLAYKNYKDGRLWWVIALVNDIKFEFTDMVVGEDILIPYNYEDVFDIIEESV